MSIQAEQHLIACALIDENSIPSLMEIPEVWFSLNEHKLIYRTIQALANESLSVDDFSVGDRLTKERKIDHVGGMEYLMQLSESVPSTAMFNSFKNSLFGSYKTSQIKSIAENIQIQAGTGAKPDEMVEYLQNAVVELMTDHHNGGFEHIGAFTDAVLAEAEWRQQNPGKRLGQEFGVKSIDDITDGAEDSKVYVIAGRPGSGKTALALEFARNLSKGDKHWFGFSLEMSGKSLAKRVMVSESKVHNNRLRTGKLSDGDYPALAAGITRMHDLKLHIDPTPSLTIPKMRSRLKAAQIKYGDVGGIIVDHIGLVGKPSNKTDTEAMNVIADDLLRLAKEFDCPVIELCQLNRGVEGRNDKRPLMSDLKQSGKIEENADVIMLLYRGDYYDKNEPPITEVIIAKNRDGETDTVYLNHDMALGRYSEAINYQPPEPEKKAKKF